MRILVLYAHPLPDSFHASLHRLVLSTLIARGHDVDDCDLYAERFDPVLSADERRGYHDTPQNQIPVANYVARLLRAEALVLCFPTWTFGPPAILKGFFDRVMMPGVAFHLDHGKPVRPGLTHLRRIVAVTTYGRPRTTVLWVGDLPRRMVTRYLRSLTGMRARVSYLAQYHMNAATPDRLGRFSRRVEAAMAAL